MQTSVLMLSKLCYPHLTSAHLSHLMVQQYDVTYHLNNFFASSASHVKLPSLSVSNFMIFFLLVQVTCIFLVHTAPIIITEASAHIPTSSFCRN